jgi:hypothetical protein
MKRLLLIVLILSVLPACARRWVGRPVTQLQKEMGRPRAIRPEGPNRIYVYPDTLAGYGEMTFTVDDKGIIRAWSATNNVQGPFGGDVFGVNEDGVFGAPTLPGQ